MKINKILLISLSALLLSGCGSNHPKTTNNDGDILLDPPFIPSNNNTGNNQGTNTETNTGGNTEINDDPTPTEIVVPAHTLKDTSFPFSIAGKGERVTEEVWDSFRYGNRSKFLDNFNYTYRAISGGSLTIEKFTKNGYYMESIGGKLYYERKSGNTFYNYYSYGGELRRQETVLDLESKYTDRIIQEIYTHMFDMSEYEYDENDGCYWSFGTYGAAVKFQNGHLTYLHYGASFGSFDIEATCETSIEIPKSVYYR